MANLRVDIVTAERQVYSGEADVVVAPGVLGQLGLLPSHAPLLARLEPGGLTIRSGDDELHVALMGGFVEVLANRIVILADAAEQAEETSTSGIILRLVDSDTVAHRVLISSDRLLWTENDSIVHYPIDNNVQNLLFEERDGNMGKILNMTVEVMSDVDTLEYAWEITLRN